MSNQHIPITQGTRLQISILIIERHSLVRAGLRMIIESDSSLNVIGEAGTLEEALLEARKQPNVILLDIDLGEEPAYDLLPQLLRASEGARILIVTGVTDVEMHCRAIRLGASGIVHKVESPSVLFTAIRKVRDGEVWLPPLMIARVLGELTRSEQSGSTDPEVEKIARLTTRERDVIALIGLGLKNRHIAERLFISEPTVRHYLGSIFDKLGVVDRLGLIVYAYQHALAKLPPRQSISKEAVMELPRDRITREH